MLCNCRTFCANTGHSGQELENARKCIVDKKPYFSGSYKKFAIADDIGKLLALIYLQSLQQLKCLQEVPPAAKLAGQHAKPPSRRIIS